MKKISIHSTAFFTLLLLSLTLSSCSKKVGCYFSATKIETDKKEVTCSDAEYYYPNCIAGIKITGTCN
ncbi:MAG: hypothetical protein ABIQ02_12365 [Saprospiraceae bacterium]